MSYVMYSLLQKHSNAAAYILGQQLWVDEALGAQRVAAGRNGLHDRHAEELVIRRRHDNITVLQSVSQTDRQSQ